MSTDLKTYVVDIETNGLFAEATKIHSLCILSLQTGKIMSCADQGGYYTIQDGLDLLNSRADRMVMHNGLAFDCRVIQKLYGYNFAERTYDTFLLSQVAFPENKGGHSLKAWGIALKCYKGDYTGGWANWSTEMQRYCEQDIRVTESLYNRLLSVDLPDTVADLEHAVSPICVHIEESGFRFNEQEAKNLYANLSARRKELSDQLVDKYGCWYESAGVVTTPTKTLTYKNPARASITEGATYTKIKLMEFNPNSRAHIINRLQVLYKWRPTEFTEKGAPRLDDSIIQNLPIKEAGDIAEYMMLQKRIGQLAEGTQAWLKLVADDGRIHGAMKQSGTNTGRSSHFRPNLAQIPAVRSLYGTECRALFIAAKNKVLLGCDAEGLELRCLAGYISKYDDGAYKHELLTGDIHQMNADILGISRDDAKTFCYALIYGAGNAKLGLIVHGKDSEYKLLKIGKQYRDKLETSLPALKALIDDIQCKFSSMGYLKGLDGRKLKPRSEHAALNALLQSAGALIMKKASVLFMKRASLAFTPGRDFKIVAWVHDEWQMEVKEEYADELGAIACEAIKDAGEFFSFPCPMAGSYKIGQNWAETH